LKRRLSTKDNFYARQQHVNLRTTKLTDIFREERLIDGQDLGNVGNRILLKIGDPSGKKQVAGSVSPTKICS